MAGESVYLTEIQRAGGKVTVNSDGSTIVTPVTTKDATYWTQGGGIHKFKVGTTVVATIGTKGLASDGPSPWYDVTAPTFGAKGDGTTNDTAAIQAAIDACEVTGGVIYFPPGTYYINQGRLIYNATKPVIFQGSGWISKLLWNPATDTPTNDHAMLNIRGNSQSDRGTFAKVCDLSFDFGGSRASAWANYKDGVNFTHFDNVFVGHCKFKGSIGFALTHITYDGSSTPSENWTCKDCLFEDWSYQSVAINPITLNVQVCNNRFYNGGSGIEFGSNFLICDGNDFELLDGAAIRLSSVNDFTVSNNRMRDCWETPFGNSDVIGYISILGGGANEGSYFGAITGNTFINRKYHGFKGGIDSHLGTSTLPSKNLVISGNTINGMPFGLYLNGGLEDSLISANRIGCIVKYTPSGSKISISATDNSFNDSDSAFLGRGFAQFMKIKSSGFTNGANNQSNLIATSVAAGKILINQYTATTISVNTTDNSFNDSAGNFLKYGFLPGHNLKTTGFTNGNNNQSNFTISTVTATKIVINAPTPDLVTESAGATATLIFGTVLVTETAGTNRTLEQAGQVAITATNNTTCNRNLVTDNYITGAWNSGKTDITGSGNTNKAFENLTDTGYFDGHWFDVKQFGAIGDGTTNDTAAIQAAIDTAIINGGIVFFPVGTYSVADLLISGAQGLQVSGSGALGNSSGKGTILKARTGATNVLKVLNCQKVTIEDMTLDGNSIASTTLLSESTNSPVSTQNRYKNLRLQGGTSIDLDIHDSGTNKQNDLTIFEDIVTNSSGSVASVRIGGQYVQLITFIGGSLSAISSCPYDVLITGGYAQFYGTMFNGSNNSASAYVKTSAGLKIYGGHFEGMTATGVETAGSGSFHVLIEGTQYMVTGNTFVNHAGTQNMTLISNTISTTTAIQRGSSAGLLYDFFTDRGNAAPNYTGAGAGGIHYFEDNGLRIINNDASPGLALKRLATTAAEYQWSIDSYGNLLLDLAGMGTFFAFVNSTNVVNFAVDIVATGGFRQTTDGWEQVDVAASQSAVLLTNTAFNTTLKANSYMAQRAGSIVGVAVKSNTARTAGTLTVEVYKNGTATGLTAVLDATYTTFKATAQAKDVSTIAAGDLLDIRITTDASWAPTTADIRAGLEIEQ